MDEAQNKPVSGSTMQSSVWTGLYFPVNSTDTVNHIVACDQHATIDYTVLIPTVDGHFSTLLEGLNHSANSANEPEDMVDLQVCYYHNDWVHITETLKGIIDFVSSK